MVRTKELDQFSNAAWSVGVRRESVIAPLAKRSRATQAEIECAATKLGLGTAMVFRLVARYRRERNTSVLAPERPGRKRGSHVLGLKLERIIRDSIGNFYLRPEKPSVAALHREIMAVSNKAGITAPCYGTVLQRVNEFDQRALMKGRVGAREAARRFTPVKDGLNVDELLGLVQIDHTLVDVIVVDEIDREPIGRPWITLAVDVATRMVLGFCLGLEAPDVTSVALTLSMAVLPKTRFLATQQLDLDWPCHGLPKRVHLDNAREFRANSLKRGCQEYGIEIVFRPPGKPHYGGHIERLIGTLMGEVHLLPGTTFSSVAQRGRYKAERAAVMTMRELETWLTLQIAGVYHMSHHRGLGKSPRQAWSEATQSCPPIRLPQNEQQFYIDFLPYQRRTIRRDGIRMFNIFYWAESLTTLLHHADRDYAVHYDRRDLSRVFVRDRQGGIIEVPYRTRSYIPVTLEEQRWAVQKLRSANATVSEKGLFDAIEKRRLIVKNARKKTMRTRRSSQKTAYALQPSNRQPATRIVESSTEASGPIEPYPVEIWE
jgi:putative transposase